MVELRDVIPGRRGARLSLAIRHGEVVGLEGDGAAIERVCELLAGGRAPRAGTVAREPDCRAVILRAGDELPAGLSPREALLFYAAAWGVAGDDAGARVDAALARSPSPLVARGRVASATLWVVASPALSAPAEAAILEVAREARAGSAALVWALGGAERRALCDRVVAVDG